MIPHLLFGHRAHKNSPFFHDATEVDRIQWNDDLSDLVVLGKPIEIVDSERERFRTEFGVRQLSAQHSKKTLNVKRISLHFSQSISFDVNLYGASYKSCMEEVHSKTT